MDLQHILRYSEEPATGPHPEPDESSLHPPPLISLMNVLPCQEISLIMLFLPASNKYETTEVWKISKAVIRKHVSFM